MSTAQHCGALWGCRPKVKDHARLWCCVMATNRKCRVTLLKQVDCPLSLQTLPQIVHATPTRLAAVRYNTALFLLTSRRMSTCRSNASCISSGTPKGSRSAAGGNPRATLRVSGVPAGQ